ncbi:MAG: hypothetical protein QM739_00160 [Propionivibrio sp.]
MQFDCLASRQGAMDDRALPGVFTDRGQDIMQITSSTIGSLYSTTLSSRLTSAASGSRPSTRNEQTGADVVTLSDAARALVEAEKAGTDASGTEKHSGNTETATKLESAREAALKKLNDYVEKGPVVARIEAIREEVLKSMGLSEADLKNLPPEQQQQIEETIAERIKEQLLQKEADKSSTTIQQSGIVQPPNTPDTAESVPA